MLTCTYISKHISKEQLHMYAAITGTWVTEANIFVLFYINDVSYTNDTYVGLLAEVGYVFCYLSCAC
jgi:hypothetical protein